MKFYRIPTKQEEQLIELLVHKSSLEMSEDWKNGLLVRPMDDGEMGSLYLFPQGKINESRKLGRQISEFQFTDIDGVSGQALMVLPLMHLPIRMLSIRSMVENHYFTVADTTLSLPTYIVCCAIVPHVLTIRFW